MLWLPSSAWRKSSYSADSGNCVEVRQNTLRLIAVRDSKTVSGHVLYFNSNDWEYFTDKVKGAGRSLRGSAGGRGDDEAVEVGGVGGGVGDG